MSDVAMTDAEQKEWDLKLRRMDADISKVNVEIEKLRAETTHILKTSIWYPLAAGSGIAVAFIGAAVTILKLFVA